MRRKDVVLAKRPAELHQRPSVADAGVWTRGLLAVVLTIVLGTIVLILGLTLATLIWIVIVLAVVGALIRATFRRRARP